MSTSRSQRGPRGRLLARVSGAGLAVTLGAAISLSGGSSAYAAQAAVGLGTAAADSVIASSTATNTGPSVLQQDLALSPGTSATGFNGPPDGTVLGTKHITDAVAAKALADANTGYNDAAGRATSVTESADLGGQTLVPGVYTGTSLSLTGPLTLNALGDPNAVFIFQASTSTLITATSSSVVLENGAQGCNVFWQVGSSATLGTDSTFVGTILANQSVTVNTNVVVSGRLFALNAAVTLDDDQIGTPTCATSTPTTTTTIGTTATTVPFCCTATKTSPVSTPVGTPLKTFTTLAPKAPTTPVTTAPAPVTKPVLSPISPVGSTGPTSGLAATSGFAPSGGGGSTTGGGGSSTGTTPLAATGVQLGGTLAAGLLAVLIGVVMLRASRRSPKKA